MLTDTIKKLEQNIATTQDLFNEVWLWFIVEKHEQSYDCNSSSCRYRLPGGRKCALGIFIPDERYDEKMDSGLWMVNDLITHLGPGYKRYEDFICDLQRNHDCSHQNEKFHNDFKRRLRILATKNSLTIPTA